MKKHILTTLFLLILGAGYWWYYSYNKKESEKYDRYREIINREDSIKNIKDSACTVNLSGFKEYKDLDLAVKFPCGWKEDTGFKKQRPIKYYTERGNALLNYIVSVIKVDGKFKDKLYDSTVFREHIVNEYKGSGIFSFSKVIKINQTPFMEISITDFNRADKGYYNTKVAAFPYHGYVIAFIGMSVSETEYESKRKFEPFSTNIHNWALKCLEDNK